MSRCRFTHCRVVTPTQIAQRDLRIDAGGRIVALLPPDAPDLPDERRVDCGGAYAFPGMLDLLTHGYGHHLYADTEPGGVAESSRLLPRHGVTAFAPSVASHAPEALLPLLRRLAGQLEAPGARVLGLHSEGPCIASPGAHKVDNLVHPSEQLAEELLEATDGQLAFVTLAPELPGAAAYCRVLTNAGVGLHLGHSMLAPEAVANAPAMGIDAVTHIYDVMFPAEVVEPGVYPLSVADALLAEDALCLGLICDGVHAHPLQVKLLAQLPPHRLFLETDSMKFAGLPGGTFELYKGMTVTTREGDAARDDNGGLAGATLTSDQALRNLVAWAGVDLPRASLATSLVPARLARRDADLGSLEPGKLADIVLLDDALTVQATYVAGRHVYQRDA